MKLRNSILFRIQGRSPAQRIWEQDAPKSSSGRDDEPAIALFHATATTSSVTAQKMKKVRKKKAHAGKRDRRKRHLSGRRYFARFVRENPSRVPWGRKYTPKKQATIEAPALLSIVRNPEEVAAFIARLKEAFDAGSPVFLVLSNITEIDYDGITVLLSVVVRFKSKGVQVRGDFPRDEGVRATLKESHFFDYLMQRKFPDKKSYKLTSNTIVTHAQQSVDSELGQELIAAASKTVWGEERRCTGIQRTFIELMQNTNNHASLEGAGEKHWWLSVKHIETEKRVAFSFVDYGVGVFYSLRHKNEGDKFFNIIQRVIEFFSAKNDADVLRLIFSGDLHRTASGKPFRGKGLPGIYQALRRNALSNFTIVTNNVFYSSQDDTYRLLKNELQGTFVYWELAQSNASLPA